jgi:hypothetical protein
VFDPRAERALLFVPRLPPSYAVWMGRILTPAELKVSFFFLWQQIG